MSAPDYSFMRTGLGGGFQRDPSWSEDDWRMVKAALLVFTEEALVLAARYAHVRGREAILPADLIACLKVQTQRGVRGVLQAHQADARLKEYDSMLREDEEEDEDEESSEEEDDQEMQDAPAVPHALDVLSDQQLTTLVDMAGAHFATWQPADRMEMIVKQAVEQTERQFCGSENSAPTGTGGPGTRA